MKWLLKLKWIGVPPLIIDKIEHAKSHLKFLIKLVFGAAMNLHFQPFPG